MGRSRLSSPSKYDRLNPRTQLEQTIAKDLEQALTKRGMTVRHNGTRTAPAKGGLADIDVFNRDIFINVEATNLTKTAADHEYPAIEEHLTNNKNQFGLKTFVVYVSPETPRRILHLVKEHNRTHSRKQDMKMLPLSFSNFELVVKALAENHPQQLTLDDLMGLFDEFESFDSDIQVLKVIQARLLPTDQSLIARISRQEEEKHQETVEELIAGLLKLEDDLRKHHVATSTNAIRNVIYLVFIKLYEEKREAEHKENRFTEEGFKAFQSLNSDPDFDNKTVHLLFDQIKQDTGLKAAKMFDESDKLADRLTDDFTLKYFIKVFDEYQFYKEKVDGLGAAYEVLGKLSGKDVKLGQFFTPLNVVRFMVELAELDAENAVLDPACGTARFLINSMEAMLARVQGQPDIKTKEDRIKKTQLFGDDYDPQVAKLAKMNMYIHGDGKTNILDLNGLLLFDFDNKTDAILTNPPLGDLSYDMPEYDSKDDGYRLKRMETIPRKNVTAEKLKGAKEKLTEWQNRLAAAEASGDQVHATKLQEKVNAWQARAVELQYLIDRDESEFVITGSQMKGGALFVTAAKYYLKSVRNPDAKVEWRGGKLIIILDEGILNDTRYKRVRDFIRKHFYIKAVISLTKDTFVPVSNTSTKTSILYAIKKEDPNAVQQEPIFYAHAAKVGIDTRKHVTDNFLDEGKDNILTRFRDFEQKVLQSYDGERFNATRFRSLKFKDGKLGE